MPTTPPKDIRLLLFVPLYSLAACNSHPTPVDNSAFNGSTINITELPADETAAANPPDGEAPASTGTLVPPAPGEPGGLPDDRRPLDEQAARNPTSVPASGATIELYSLALSVGRYGDAYRLWADGGRQSGLTEAQFTQAYRRYSDVHVLVGRPEAIDDKTVRVPVQMYGRMREGQTPFNHIGLMTLTRNPKGQQGQAGQPAWLITRSDLEPDGTVKVTGATAAAQAGLIPAEFRGRWSETRESCARPGDPSRLAIHADRLIFYESEALVQEVRPRSANEISVSARYSGEGENWSHTSTLTLSPDNGLLLDGMRRIRCSD